MAILSVLKLTLLHPFALALDGTPIALASRRTEALLIYLLLTRQPQSRDTLATLLYDNLPQQTAAGNLRVLLSNLRKPLAAHLDVQRHTLAFDEHAPFECDVFALTRAMQTASDVQTRGHGLSRSATQMLALALDRYSGELLPGFSLRDGQGFEEWLAIEREWLHTRVLQALSSVALAFLHFGNWPAGIPQAQRLVRLDPLREEGHLLLMRLLIADGQRHAAILQFERCSQILQTEFGVTPGAVLRDLHGKLARDEKIIEDAPLLPVPIPHNLPRATGDFIGRAAEMAHITKLLSAVSTTMVSIIGPGGMGKTALAIELARALLHNKPDGTHLFSDGVFFVSLAPLSDAAAIPAAIANAIGYQWQRDMRDERAQLFGHLHDQALLLILDNCEHLEAATELLDALLLAAPDVRLLLTSRHKLKCRAEQVVMLTGLDVPSLVPTDPHEAARDVEGRIGLSDAVQLFQAGVDRALGVQPRSTQDLIDISNICRLVQGMPLAILLAASWVELHTFSEIAARLHKLLALPVSVAGNPTRQHSMSAVFDYSWHLLSPEEQRGLARMSIFRTGCERELARAVTGATPQQLLALEQKSCLQRDLSSGQFSMHTLMRQWAATKLLELGEAAAPLHALAVDNLVRLHASDLTPHLVELAHHAELAGLIEAACTYLQRAGDAARAAWQYRLACEHYGRALALMPLADTATRFALHLARVDLQHLLGNRSEQALELHALESLAASLADPARLATVALARSRHAEAIGQYATASQAAAKAVALAEPLHDTRLLAEANLAWGAGLRRENAFAPAVQRLTLAAQHATAAALPMVEADAQRNLGIIAAYQGDYIAAQIHFAHTLRIFQQLGDRPGEAAALGNLGVLQLYLADYARARPYLEQSLALFRQLGDRRRTCIGLNNLATVAHKLSDVAQAERLLEQSLATAIEINDVQSRREAHSLLAHLQVDAGRFADARSNYDAALQLALGFQSRCGEVEARVGLAGLEAVPASALASIEPLLRDVNETLLAQAEDALRVYLSCGRILLANGDVRAPLVFAEARRILHTRAVRIQDHGLRAAFLHNNPVHRWVIAG